MKMKKSKGFSYIEVLIAMALFAIAMLAVIPAMQQAGRNMIYAQEAYAGHLQAQNLMLVVRDAIAEGVPPESRAMEYANGGFEFSVWVNNRWVHSDSSLEAEEPGVNAVLHSINTAVVNQASIIIVVVWCEDNRIIGRALGIQYG